jgi:hypothetical protein
MTPAEPLGPEGTTRDASAPPEPPGGLGALQLIMGAEVACTDGPCGHLRLVVVDLKARTVTHLAVGQGHWPSGRLVPIEVVDGTDNEIRLRSTLS